MEASSPFCMEVLVDTLCPLLDIPGWQKRSGGGELIVNLSGNAQVNSASMVLNTEDPL